MNQIASELQAEHKVWLDQIRAWERELDTLADVNGEIVGKVDTKEARKKVEHFQNQFIIQKNRLDEMKHNIKIYGGNIDKGSQEIEEYREYYNTLKGEFDTFSASWS